MTGTPGTHHIPHSAKLYIVIATVVIGAIVILLLINDDNFSFTGAITGENGKIPIIAPLTTTGAAVPTGANKAVETVFKNEVDKGGKDVNLGLTFSQIPEMNIVNAKDIESIVLEFTADAGVSTSINVNEDRLELTDLQEIKLEVREFKGNIHVAKHAEFSLDGTARQIDVNGVGLHSGKEMKISLRDLDFNALHIKEIVLNNLQLPQGSGSLKVTDKLSYTLEDDSMGIYYFKGDVDITEGSSDAFVLEGEARGISANGDVLSLNLR